MDEHDTFSGRTPLHLACIRGHFELAERFVKHGVDLASLDAQGRTCLWHLVEKEDLRALQVLLDGPCATALRAAVNVQNSKEGNLMIMMLAVKGRLHSIIKFLHGVSDLDLDIEDSLERTALRFAAGDASRLELLTNARVSAEMNMNMRDWSGRALLQCV